VIPVTDTGVAPSVYVRFQGPVPVSVTDTAAEPPLQIVVEPLTTAAGRGAIVITADPVRSPAWAVQPASFKLEIVYVVAVAGSAVKV
jgi:hypothetical protein